MVDLKGQYVQKFWRSNVIHQKSRGITSQIIITV
jgi:hypothetical protein